MTCIRFVLISCQFVQFTSLQFHITSFRLVSFHVISGHFIFSSCSCSFHLVVFYVYDISVCVHFIFISLDVFHWFDSLIVLNV